MARPDSNALERWRQATDGPLLALSIGSLPLLMLELIRNDLSSADRMFLDIVNISVLVAFATDYVVELVLARDRRGHITREWSSLVIVAAQALALAPGLAGIGALRAARGLRPLGAIVAIVRLVAVGGASARQGRRIVRRRAASFALGAAALTWLSSAVAFCLAEGVGDSDRVNSFGVALWWSTSTITTVGYGDVYPVTTMGRLVGAVTMVVGISTFAVVTAKVAEFLVRPDSTEPQRSGSDLDGK